MATLDYESPRKEPTSTAKSLALFAPAAISIAIFLICFYSLPVNMCDSICIVSFWIAEIATVIALCVWRGQLKRSAFLVGLFLAGFGAMYLGVIAAVAVGILQTP